MKSLVLGLFILELTAGFSFVPPSGNQQSLLAVLQNLFLGKELKDFPNCGRQRTISEVDADHGSRDGVNKGATRQQGGISEEKRKYYLIPKLVTVFLLCLQVQFYLYQL